MTKEYCDTMFKTKNFIIYFTHTVNREIIKNSTPLEDLTGLL